MPSIWKSNIKIQGPVAQCLVIVLCICPPLILSVGRTMTAFNVLANGMTSSNNNNLPMVSAQQSAALGLAEIRLPPLSIIDNLKPRPLGACHAVELPHR